MARSQEDPLFGDIQHRSWNYLSDGVESCASSPIGEHTQQPLYTNTSSMSDNMYVNSNQYHNSNTFINSASYTVNRPPPPDKQEESINNLTNAPRGNVPGYGNAMLDLGNGQIMRVLIPVSGHYELFNNNVGRMDIPLQPPHTSHMFINKDCLSKGLKEDSPTVTASQSTTFVKDNTQSHEQTSSFLKDMLGNWEPNSSGTYSPFGHSFPLNHPEAPALNLPKNNPHNVELPVQSSVSNQELSPKRNENSPLADTHSRKRIVAEVKPMRPSYSDVLAKNTKNNLNAENTKKAKTSTNVDSKQTKKSANVKAERQANNKKQPNEESKARSENKKVINTPSSGSESGDITIDENEKHPKSNKKSKNKHSQQKWPSIDDLTKEEGDYKPNANSQFVFIATQADKPTKKEKKNKEKSKPAGDNDDDYIEYKFEDDANSQDFQEGFTDASKTKKKKESRSYTHKLSKPTPDKKKAIQSKWKKNKPGYLGLVQNYLDHWYGVTWKAVAWFLYLVSDICHMSAHLSFDLCTSVFTHTYVSCQAIWRSSMDNIYKITNNKYLHYIDRKFGHTRFGFWRKIKWFNKDSEAEDAASKLDFNISLPATGEEAMKRLLACKGKDPYSILGVSPSCSDEDIKRYYRRQAFLVHPDKNSQPGAEEAFKILQHAFELIGEPARRSAYGEASAACAQAEAAWSELSTLLDQLHDKMEFAANTIRCTNCGRRHKRVLTDRPCYAARYCAQCKIRHSAKEGDIWAESSMWGLLVMYYACMDGGVYQITQWASCQKKNLKQIRPDCHVVQYRIVLGNKASGSDINRAHPGYDPNLEEFLNNLYSKSGPVGPTSKQPTPEQDRKRRPKKKV